MLLGCWSCDRAGCGDRCLVGQLPPITPGSRDLNTVFSLVSTGHVIRVWTNQRQSCDWGQWSVGGHQHSWGINMWFKYQGILGIYHSPCWPLKVVLWAFSPSSKGHWTFLVFWFSDRWPSPQIARNWRVNTKLTTTNKVRAYNNPVPETFFVCVTPHLTIMISPALFNTLSSV